MARRVSQVAGLGTWGFVCLSCLLHLVGYAVIGFPQTRRHSPPQLVELLLHEVVSGRRAGKLSALPRTPPRSASPTLGLTSSAGASSSLVAATAAALAPETWQPEQIVSQGNRLPLYPSLALKMGWSGDLVLCFVIGREGAVQGLSVCEGEAHSVFEEAALRAARDWRFPVGVVAEQTAVRVPIEFRLQ